MSGRLGMKRGFSRASGPDRLLYIAWKSMRNRCLNPSNKDYRYYGGRGIRVCRSWDDYDVFAEDMGPKPIGMTLDRIDTNGPYRKDNCQWISRADQTRNCRRNRYIEASGERLLISEWARRLNGSPSVVSCRIGRGWDPVRAVTTEVRGSR